MINSVHLEQRLPLSLQPVQGIAAVEMNHHHYQSHFPDLEVIAPGVHKKEEATSSLKNKCSTHADHYSKQATSVIQPGWLVWLVYKRMVKKDRDITHLHDEQSKVTPRWNRISAALLLWHTRAFINKKNVIHQ